MDERDALRSSDRLSAMTRIQRVIMAEFLKIINHQNHHHDQHPRKSYEQHTIEPFPNPFRSGRTNFNPSG